MVMLKINRDSLEKTEVDVPQITQDLDLLNDLATLLMVSANKELAQAELTFTMMEDR